jgi:hypothetical protein
MKRNTLLTVALVTFIMGLLMLTKVFSANSAQSSIQCDHEACIASGFHLNVSK